METAVDPGKEILQRIADLEVERAKIEAETTSLMLDFQDLRRRESERQTDSRRREMEAGFAADELGVSLHQPTRTVQVRLSESRRVRNLMPLTWLAFTSGRIDAYRLA